MDSSSEKLHKAISLIKLGEKAKGSEILTNLLILEPGLELAWIWLADCATTRERKIQCLQMANKINPTRMSVQNALVNLNCVPQKGPKLAAPEKTIPKVIQTQYHQQTDIYNKEPLKSRLPDIVLSSKHIRTAGKSLPKKKELKTQSQKSKEISYQEQESDSKLYEKADGDHRKKNTKKVKRKNLKTEVNENSSALGSEGGTNKSISMKDHIYQSPVKVTVKPDDNLYADIYWKHHKRYSTDSGMFGNTMFIDDVRINAFNMPKCLKLGYLLNFTQCEKCSFFSPYDCLLRSEPELINELSIFIISKRKKIVDYQKRKKAAIQAIFIELKAHGRPLHYTVLTSIIHKRHPSLGLTEFSVLKTMSSHPEVFEYVDVGLYKYKKSKTY